MNPSPCFYQFLRPNTKSEVQPNLRFFFILRAICGFLFGLSLYSIIYKLSRNIQFITHVEVFIIPYLVHIIPPQGVPLVINYITKNDLLQGICVNATNFSPSLFLCLLLPNIWGAERYFQDLAYRLRYIALSSSCTTDE